ncbi:MAG: NUDIX domain-containing protein [Candidatus Woesebacteria bacterium]
MILSNIQAKRCHTATAWTLYQGKTLLIKHKKLGIWLAPGGHVENNELPHLAAAREFEEESGVKVQVVSAFPVEMSGKVSEYLPLPFYCNLHEVNKPRGNSFCEQHYSWGYFVKVLDTSGFNENDEGVEGVGWFTQQEMKALETTDDIRNEAAYVFSHFPKV